MTLLNHFGHASESTSLQSSIAAQNMLNFLLDTSFPVHKESAVTFSLVDSPVVQREKTSNFVPGNEETTHK